MEYLSESKKRLKTKTIIVQRLDDFSVLEKSDVQILCLPPHADISNHKEWWEILRALIQLLQSNSTFIVVGAVEDLVAVDKLIEGKLRYQNWIVIKTVNELSDKDITRLPMKHFGAVIYTKYAGSLKHKRIRLKYSKCPACGKTTKDYGGKKHTFHSYGTLISDVWKGLEVDFDKDLRNLVVVFADLFAIDEYTTLTFYDYRTVHFGKRHEILPISQSSAIKAATVPEGIKNTVIMGDCIKALSKIPDNSIDFIFADPPYNVEKKYTGYSDDREISNYFEWCDTWIDLLARVLKPGHTLAVLNIPLWSIRHFRRLNSILNFQNWIVWDALSFPARFIMPAHYAILIFSKGIPRKLPGLVRLNGCAVQRADNEYLYAGHENYCLRLDCITTHQRPEIRDQLSDVWTDIHRLKHNSKRVNHPTQLPPQLMYRLITLYTNPDEIVLDCFNGAGTTTLTAHQLQRKYIGIELESEYVNLAQKRHQEILSGLDPFRKNDIGSESKAKNSKVERLSKQQYIVPKKVLQLEVKAIALKLGRLPTREDVMRHSIYPIAYFETYFLSWSEVCAAARAAGIFKKTASMTSLFNVLN